MENRLFYLAMGCALVPFFITIIQLVIFSINKEKYDSLLSFYHDARFELPPPLQVLWVYGVFGVVWHVLFLLKTQKRKKGHFSAQTTRCYYRASERHELQPHWMD